MEDYLSRVPVSFLSILVSGLCWALRIRKCLSHRHHAHATCIWTNFRTTGRKIWDVFYWNKENLKEIKLCRAMDGGHSEVQEPSIGSLGGIIQLYYWSKGTIGWKTHFRVLILIHVPLKWLFQYKSFFFNDIPNQNYIGINCTLLEFSENSSYPLVSVYYV